MRYKIEVSLKAGYKLQLSTILNFKYILFIIYVYTY